MIGDYQVTLHAEGADDVIVTVHLVDTGSDLPDGGQDDTPMPDSGDSTPILDEPQDVTPNSSSNDTNAEKGRSADGQIDSARLPKTGDSAASLPFWGLLLVSGTILYLKRK